MIQPQARPTPLGWTRLEVAGLALIVLAGGLLRFVGLGDPSEIMFDETYYAKDACWYVEASERICDTDHEQTLVHPPLGKWILAGGVALFGYDSFGWRFGAALAGTATIPLLYLLARLLLRARLPAALAAGLLAIDLLHFVQSRIAMIDVFATLFGVAAVLFAVYDRERLLRRGPSRPNLLGHPWRIAAGAAAGAAVASKWSGAFFLVFVLALTLAWELGARRARGETRPLLRTLAAETPSILLWLVALPLMVYAATYAARLDGTVFAAPWAEGSFWRALWDQQFHMLEFHTEHLSDKLHPYQSRPWSWLLLKRPVSYYFDTTPSGEYMEVMAMGSPLVWWASIPALVYVALRWVRDHRLGNAAGVIAGGFLITYLPWVLIPVDREAVFLFYLLPSVPFMCLALAFVAQRILPYVEGKIAVAAFVAAALAFFVFFYPLVAKVPISKEQWDQRIRFRDCNEKVEEDGPPKGWCWI